MLLLYEHPLSPYAQKCKISMREKGIAFEARTPLGIGSGAGLDERFVKASPRGEVPLLLAGEQAIFESSVILAWLEETQPQPALLPADPDARARERMLEARIDGDYEAIPWALGELRYFRRAEGELAARLEAVAASDLERWHGWLESQLGASEWLSGERFGHADLCAIPFLNAASGFELGPAPGSALAAWQQRANARPSVAQTASEARASIAQMAGVAELVKQGSFRRQYRDHRLEWMLRAGGLEVVRRGLERDDIRFDEPPGVRDEPPRGGGA